MISGPQPLQTALMRRSTTIQQAHIPCPNPLEFTLFYPGVRSRFMALLIRLFGNREHGSFVTDETGVECNLVNVIFLSTDLL